MAVAVQGENLDDLVHEGALTGFEESFHALAVRFAIALGDNRILDLLVGEFFLAPAENTFRLVVPAGDVPVEIHLHQRIDRRLLGELALDAAANDVGRARVRETDDRGQIYLRAFRERTAAAAFVEKRLAQFEKLWDG